MTISSSKALSSGQGRGIYSVDNLVTDPYSPTTRLLAYDSVLGVGNGIINADGDLWKRQRKAGLPFFSNANLKAFVDRVLPHYLKDTEKCLEHAASNTDPIDMEAIFLELTTKLMGEMAYDVRVNPISPLKCRGWAITTTFRS